MKLKNAVNELMDFSVAHECDLDVACAKMAHEIKSGSRDFMTMGELDEARAFVKDISNYKIVVEARKSGDDTDYDAALAEWQS